MQSSNVLSSASGIMEVINGNRIRIVEALGVSLAIWIIQKYLRKVNERRNCSKKLTKKIAQLKEKMKKYEMKYSEITEEQKGIVELELSELKAKLDFGDLSAVQVLEAYIAKAIQVNKITNSVVEFLDDAMERAIGLDSLPQESRGPLHGLPVSLKEHIFVENHDCTVGIVNNIGKTCEKDAELVRVLKMLGAVPFCRTNLSQTCISFDCSNPIFGITKHFKDQKRTPGGSSGGEGALIAGGGSVLGFGSDLGGSVRIPSAFCGIASLKPTAGRVPQTGQALDGGLVGVVGVYSTLGFMSRSVSAISVFAKEMLSEDIVSKVSVDPRFVPIPWNEAKMRKNEKLRIGWYDFDGCSPVTPGISRVVKEAAEILRNNGHEVVPFRPSNLKEASKAWGVLCFAEEMRNTLGLLGEGPEDTQALGWGMTIFRLPFWLRKPISYLIRFWSPILANSLIVSENSRKSWQLWKLHANRLALTEETLKNWDDNHIDIVICPTGPMPAQPLGYPAYQRGPSYANAYNVLNFPAGSLPIGEENPEDQDALKHYPGFETDLIYGWIKEGTKGAIGMPLNVQVVGRPWSEELVLRVMQELEDEIMKKNSI